MIPYPYLIHFLCPPRRTLYRMMLLENRCWDFWFPLLRRWMRLVFCQKLMKLQTIPKIHQLWANHLEPLLRLDHLYLQNTWLPQVQVGQQQQHLAAVLDAKPDQHQCWLLPPNMLQLCHLHLLTTTMVDPKDRPEEGWCAALSKWKSFYMEMEKGPKLQQKHQPLILWLNIQ